MWSRITEALEWCGSIHGRQKKQGSFIRINYTVSQKKQDTILLCITSPNVNRFSKFFYWQTQWQICNKRTHTHTHNRLTAFVWDNLGKPQKNTHQLTPNLIIGHPLSSSSTYNDSWHPLCSFYVLDNPLRQPLSRSYLVFLLVLDPELLAPYISSASHHNLFAAHAHTNTACSAAKPMLCHVYLVSLSAPYLGVCLLA